MANKKSLAGWKFIGPAHVTWHYVDAEGYTLISLSKTNRQGTWRVWVRSSSDARWPLEPVKIDGRFNTEKVKLLAGMML